MGCKRGGLGVAARRPLQCYLAISSGAAKILDCGGRAQRRHRFRAPDHPRWFVRRSPGRKRRGASLPAAVQKSLAAAPPRCALAFRRVGQPTGYAWLKLLKIPRKMEPPHVGCYSFQSMSGVIVYPPSAVAMQWETGSARVPRAAAGGSSRPCFFTFSEQVDEVCGATPPTTRRRRVLPQFQLLGFGLGRRANCQEGG